MVTKPSLLRLWQVRTRRTPLGRTKTASRLPEFGRFVSEADRDEILEEHVESLDVAGHVGRKVPRPFNSPPEGGIRAALAVNVPPACRFQHDERIRQWAFASKPTGDGLDFVRDVGGFVITRECVIDIDPEVVV